MEDTVLNNICVPIDWVCSYRQIQFLLVEYGVSAIQGCDNVCAPKNKSIIQLWNLFKNAAFLYEKGYTDKANTIYEFVKRALTKYENVDVGSSEIHVEDAIVTIKCIGNNYEFDDIKEVYTFEINDKEQLNIQDNGIGQTIEFNVISKKTISIGSKVEELFIDYNFALDNLSDYSWIIWNKSNHSIIIKENKVSVRTAKFRLIQNESNNVLNGVINQELSKLTYRYTITIFPERIELPSEGGRETFVVNSYKELTNESDEVIGDKILVPYKATSSNKYFVVNGNSVSAEANTSFPRSGSIIIEREEVGVEGNKKIEVSQDSLNKEIRYTLNANVDRNTIDVNGTNPVKLTVESYKETYVNGEAQGDKVAVNYTVRSEKGLLKNNTSDKTKWYMSANTSTEIRTDNIIVTQTESNKQETIAIKQDAAEETFEYTFSCDQEVINAPNSGTSIILNIQSFKQYYINGKPSNKESVAYTGEVTNGSDFITITPSLPNSITINKNDNEEERTGRIRYTQNEVNGKDLVVNIIQVGASIQYDYFFETDDSNEITLTQYANANKDIVIRSYKKKKVNGQYEGGNINVNFDLTTALSGEIINLVSVNANSQDSKIYIRSILNTTNNRYTGNIVVTQSESADGIGKTLLFTIIKEASKVEYQYILDVRPESIKCDAYAPKGYDFEVLKNNRLTYINDELYRTDENLHWQASADVDWIKTGGQDVTHFNVDENTDEFHIRDGKITVHIIDDYENTADKKISVNQKKSESHDEYIMYVTGDFYLFRNKREITNPYMLKHEYYRNGRKINSVDETQQYKGKSFAVNRECSQSYCEHFYGEYNCYIFTITIRYDYNPPIGTNTYAFINYRTTDGKYENAVPCTFTMLDTDSVMFLRYYDSSYDTNIYDYFYHYIPDNLKCLYADLLKVFITSHNDSHKLRKAIFNINLFQSLIAAHFFKMQKKYELFLKMIVSYLNNWFKDNDISYEYHIEEIEEDGHVYMDVLPCQKQADVKLELDPITGHLHEIDNSDNTENIEFEIEDSHLILTKYGYTR